MHRIEATLCRFFTALNSDSYDIGVLANRSMFPRLEALPPSRIVEMLLYLKYRNVQGANLYLRPSGESRFTLLDDLTSESLARLNAEGFTHSAVIETSPGNYQAWLKHAQPLPKEISTLAAKLLAARFGADKGAADWRRFGRMPGFTNRKPKHQDVNGRYPFARLLACSGDTFPQAEAFHEELVALFERQKAEQRVSRSRSFARAILPSPSLTLARFRSASRYAGQPAAADMAFAITAYAHGWSDDAISAELATNYLSRGQSRRRRDMYIQRTLTKALQWVSKS